MGDTDSTGLDLRLGGIPQTLSTRKGTRDQEWARQSSDGYIRFVAVSQLLGVAGMLFPIPTGIFPWLTPLAAIGFCIIQILAAQRHIRLKEYNILPMNLFLFALSLFRNIIHGLEPIKKKIRPLMTR